MTCKFFFFFVQVIGILILIDVSLINGTEIWLRFGDFGEGG